MCAVDHVIQVECYDWNSNGSHDLIGEFTTTLAELEQTSAGKIWLQHRPCNIIMLLTVILHLSVIDLTDI